MFRLHFGRLQDKKKQLTLILIKLNYLNTLKHILLITSALTDVAAETIWQFNRSILYL